MASIDTVEVYLDDVDLSATDPIDFWYPSTDFGPSELREPYIALPSTNSTLSSGFEAQ
jgi:hypothetical protein